VPAPAKGVEGDWQGTLRAGETELRLALHIAKSAAGAYRATMDSIDQGAKGIPVTSMSFQDSELIFSVDSIQGSYAGTASGDGTAMIGTWSQRGQSFPLDFKRATTPIKTEHKLAKPTDIDGAWLGTLEADAIKLRVVFQLTNTQDGLMATMDSPDQGAEGIPATSVKRDGASLTIEMRQLGGVFEGAINNDLTTIDGTWSQGGSTKPLVLKRTKDAAGLEPPRFPNPVRPYPYREEEVTYENKLADISEPLRWPFRRATAVSCPGLNYGWSLASGHCCPHSASKLLTSSARVLKYRPCVCRSTSSLEASSSTTSC
jgi:hypothetical protein